MSHVYKHKENVVENVEFSVFIYCHHSSDGGNNLFITMHPAMHASVLFGKYNKVTCLSVYVYVQR